MRFREAAMCTSPRHHITLVTLGILMDSVGSEYVNATYDLDKPMSVISKVGKGLSIDEWLADCVPNAMANHTLQTRWQTTL